MEGEARLWPQMLIFVHQLPSMLQWRKGVCSAWLAQTDQSPHSVSPCPLGSLAGPQLCVKDKLRLWLTTEGRFLQSLICYSSKPETFTLSLSHGRLWFLSPIQSVFLSLTNYLHFHLLPSECVLCLRCLCPISLLTFPFNVHLKCLSTTGITNTQKQTN